MVPIGNALPLAKPADVATRATEQLSVAVEEYVTIAVHAPAFGFTVILEGQVITGAVLSIGVKVTVSLVDEKIAEFLPEGTCAIVTSIFSIPCV